MPNRKNEERPPGGHQFEAVQIAPDGWWVIREPIAGEPYYYVYADNASSWEIQPRAFGAIVWQLGLQSTGAIPVDIALSVVPLCQSQATLVQHQGEGMSKWKIAETRAQILTTTERALDLLEHWGRWAVQEGHPDAIPPPVESTRRLLSECRITEPGPSTKQLLREDLEEAFCGHDPTARR